MTELMAPLSYQKKLTSLRYVFKLIKRLFEAKFLRRVFKRSTHLKPWFALTCFMMLLGAVWVIRPAFEALHTTVGLWLETQFSTSHPDDAPAEAPSDLSSPSGDPSSSSPWLVSPPPARRKKANQGKHFGKTVSVTLKRCYDGDTCQFMVKGEDTPMKVRVAQVDAPELAQDYGKEARDYLVGLLRRAKKLELSCQGGKTYDREACAVLVEGEPVQPKLVAAGYAWDYPLYSKGQYALLQAKARQGKKGVWQEAHPMSPFCWRKLYKNQQRHGRCEQNAMYVP
ncbi:MAG: thermonuclease family protein [Vampirovibrionales bacterium]